MWEAKKIQSELGVIDRRTDERGIEIAIKPKFNALSLSLSLSLSTSVGASLPLYLRNWTPSFFSEGGNLSLALDLTDPCVLF